MSEGNLVKYWAVLIGINFYPKNRLDGSVQGGEKPLQGCVRDVESIREHLETKPTRVNLAVKIFTSSAPSDPAAGYPAEEEESWPTYGNVTSCLTKIIEEAKPGDFVYIHYSGHGTQMPGTSSEYINRNTGDLALVLFDAVHGVRYLRGQKLASLINQMVKKGLRVTVVLDCCFSGSVVRSSDPNGASIREVNYDPAIDASYPENLDACLSQQVGQSALRDARMLPNWLIDPDGYSVLTACGPHERAYELKFSDGQKNGALSYFLLQALTALRKSDVEITQQSLYQHLCVRFHASWPRQNPMRYGNKNFSFFGKLRSADMTFVSVMQKDGRLHLEAGQVHGVNKGDEYALYQLDTLEDVANYDQHASARAVVDAVWGLTSDLIVIEPSFLTGQVKTGWKARPLTHLSPRTVLVRLRSELDNQPEWLAATQRRFICLCIESGEDRPCLFSVKRNISSEYEILDASCQRITSVPTIPIDRKGAVDSVLDLLEHLATFKYVEGIENRIPTPSFEASIKVQLTDGNGNDHRAVGYLDVNHEDKLHLMVENLGTRPLYIAILDMGSSWQITNLTGKSGVGGFLVAPPQDDKKGHTGRVQVKWRMIVPESLRDEGQYHCEDVIKIFVTTRPTSFAPLVLPKISTSTGEVDGRIRGDRNLLSDFLSGLATPYRGAECDEEWLTRNLLVRTQFKKDSV